MLTGSDMAVLLQAIKGYARIERADDEDEGTAASFMYGSRLDSLTIHIRKGVAGFEYQVSLVHEAVHLAQWVRGAMSNNIGTLVPLKLDAVPKAHRSVVDRRVNSYAQEMRGVEFQAYAVEAWFKQEPSQAVAWLVNQLLSPV